MGIWDEYVTPRYAKIKDRRLGCLQMTLMISIFMYAVVFQIVLGKGYMKTEDPAGTVRFRLMAPQMQYLPEAEVDAVYCAHALGETYTDPTNPARQFDKQRCAWEYDGYSEPYPESEETSLTVTTRVSKSDQLREGALCGSLDATARDQCSFETDGAEESFFIPQVEYFTLLMSHTMFAAGIDIHKSAWDMKGIIVDRDGNQLDPCDDYTDRGKECPPYVTITGDGDDIFPIRTLMRAAGVDLDQESETSLRNSENDKHVSNRWEGLVLLLDIFYDNTLTFDADAFQYTISAHHVPKSEYKVEQVIYTEAAMASRTILNRHGVRIMVNQSGTVGKFSFQWLLIQLIAATGLLAVARLLTKMLAIHLLKEKVEYRKAIFRTAEVDGEWEDDIVENLGLGLGEDDADDKGVALMSKKSEGGDAEANEKTGLVQP